MKSNSLRLLIATLFTWMVCLPIALSQTVTGTITGEVTDPSGAVVAGAQVVAHNLETGVDSPGTTNSSGLYRIEFLPIGHYQVTVQATGFSTATLAPFSLEALQTASFNVKLVVGSSATTVKISAASPILETGDTTLDSTFTANTSPIPAFWVAGGTHDTSDYKPATVFVAAMDRVEQVPFYKLNAGDTANAWQAALPVALTWLWQQLAPPDLRVLFPVRASARGLFSTLPVPPVKGHDPGPCVPAKGPGPAVLPCAKIPLGQARKA